MKSKLKFLMAGLLDRISWSLRCARLDASLCAANIGEGVVENGHVSKQTDVVISLRYALVKQGAGANTVAICTATDIPLGIAEDEAKAAGDTIEVAAFGAIKGTRRVVASGVIAQDAFVVPDAAGKVKTLPVVTGTYRVIGRALIPAAADLDVVIIAPLFYTDRVP